MARNSLIVAWRKGTLENRQELIRTAVQDCATMEQIGRRFAVSGETIRLYIRKMPDAPAVRRQLTLRRRGLHAFGEVKTRQEWAQDPRCVVSVENMAHRLGLGWPPEDALSCPLKESRHIHTSFTREEIAAMVSEASACR